jgi:hypothetical protein
MPTSAQPNGSPSDKPGKSRLEREIEEILERAEREHPLPPPTPFEARLRKQASKESGPRVDLSSLAESARRWLDTAPLLVAFGAAILALIVRNVSPFLATVAATAAVVALFWPIVASFRNPRPEAKTWRGRTYETRQEPPELVMRLRAWLRDRNNRK